MYDSCIKNFLIPKKNLAVPEQPPKPPWLTKDHVP